MNKKNRVFQKNQWFFEKNVPGVCSTIETGIKIKKKIFSGRTPYQEIEVIDTFSFGLILALDGIIQLSQLDEFIYHEMLVHQAMFSHRNPKKVLIIGGGDGGALREVLKHPVEEVYLVDIDKKVIEVSKKYLPFVSKGAFRDKRAKIFIEDGIKFIKNFKNFFDIIIIDSTDPSGPSLGLFSQNFYQDAFKALSKEGIVSVQTGCLLEQISGVKKVFKKLEKIFPSVRIHKACVPCYQCSIEYSFTIASKFDLGKIVLKNIEKRFKKLNLDLKYYRPEIHFSSAVLPRYLEKRLK
jgi:spermidine synthase